DLLQLLGLAAEEREEQMSEILLEMVGHSGLIRLERMIEMIVLSSIGDVIDIERPQLCGGSMVGNSFSQDEKSTLAVLRRFEGIDDSSDATLDSITALVARFFNAPISVISVIFQGRIIVKSLYGLEKGQIDHLAEWLMEAIATDDVFCI